MIHGIYRATYVIIFQVPNRNYYDNSNKFVEGLCSPVDYSLKH